MVTDYQRNYGRAKLHKCLVCDSPNRELIDILLRGGGGSPSVSRFLRERLGETISQAVVNRHKTEHLDAEDAEEKR